MRTQRDEAQALREGLLELVEATFGADDPRTKEIRIMLPPHLLARFDEYRTPPANVQTAP